MRKWVLIIICLAFTAILLPNISGNDRENGSRVVFINASQSKNGNTVKMAENILSGIEYEQINLNDYRIAFLGQEDKEDQFDDILKKLYKAEVIVIGTPVYWHSMSGSLKTFIDRLYNIRNSSYSLDGKDLYFFMQGSAPTELSINSAEYIIERVAYQMGMNLKGVADNDKEIEEMRNKLNSK